jgi:hypothetical protein
MPQDMRGLTQCECCCCTAAAIQYSIADASPLTDIADLRACRVRELEEKRVNKEMAHIRQKFKGG